MNAEVDVQRAHLIPEFQTLLIDIAPTEVKVISGEKKNHHGQKTRRSGVKKEERLKGGGETL